MIEPLISVIIPTYNRAERIVQCVNSVLEQSYRNTEILVCDDGSTDDTEEIVRSIKDDRVKWIKSEINTGRPAVPRNIGIQNSNGEWIAFLDSDDIWIPDKLEKQIKAVQLLNLKASCTNASRIAGNKEEKFIYWNKSKISFSDLYFGNLVISSSAMIHRTLIDNIIGFPEDEKLKAIEDYSLWLRVATYSDFAFIASEKLIYNDTPQKSVRQSEINIFDSRKIVFEDYKAWDSKRIDRSKRNELSFISNLKPGSIYPIAVNIYKKISRMYFGN